MVPKGRQDPRLVMVVNITSDSLGAAVIAHPEGGGEVEEMPVPQKAGGGGW